MKCIKVLILLIIYTVSHAQTSIIKGIIKDKVSELELIGASIGLVGDSINGATSDENGRFKIENVNPGRQTIVIQYIGYKTITIPNILVTSGKDSDVEISMEENIEELKEVVVSSKVDKDKALNEMATISARTFSLEEVTRYSGGRNDASRLVSNFAGVATSNDSRNDIVVRGNSPAGVLWRMEGIPIPNPNHFSTLGTTGGPVSALNTNLLKNSDFLTSAFPAEYGNALSGVFDVGLRSGNKDKHEFTVQLAAFSGLEAMAEGPLGKKGNASYLVSYRYSFVQLADVFGLNFGTSAIPKYQDLTYHIDLGKSKYGNLKFFGIKGKSDINFVGRDLKEDDFFAEKDADSDAHSRINIYGAKHTFMLNDKNYIRTTLSYSSAGNKYHEYRYKDTTFTSKLTYNDVDDNTNRVSIHTFINTKYSALFSSRIGMTVDHKILKSTVESRDNNPDINKDGDPDLLKVRDIDGNITFYEPYASFKLKLSNKLSAVTGLHALIQSYKHKAQIEPRMSLNYALSPKIDFNFGYGLLAQSQPLPVFFLKSLNEKNELTTLNDNLDFSKAHHFVIGTDIKPWNQWRIKSEAYYQYLFDVAVEKKNSSFSILNAGADFVFPQVGNLVNNGSGKNYGLEFTLEKFFSNKFYGLLTTSIFQSKYKGSDGIERNSAFNNQFVFNTLAGKEWNITKKTVLTSDFKFTYAGGRFGTPIDLEKSKQTGQQVLFENKAFSEKLSNYMRLDFKIGVRMNNKGFSQQFFLDFQNITNNKNIFIQKYNRATSGITNVYQIGFFPDLLWRVQF